MVVVVGALVDVLVLVVGVVVEDACVEVVTATVVVVVVGMGSHVHATHCSPGGHSIAPLGELASHSSAPFTNPSPQTGVVVVLVDVVDVVVVLVVGHAPGSKS